MADIRIKDLPLATGGTAPSGTDAIAIDGLTTRKTTISTLGDVAVPVASQAEAEAGSNASKRMTPLTTKQSIASEVGDTIASAAQGALADTSVQPEDLSTVATTGAYADLTGKPTLGGASSLNVGTTAGTVAAGDDSRIVGALAVANKATTPEMVAGVENTHYTTPQRVSDAIQGLPFKSQSTGAFARSLPVRFGDVIDLAEFIDPAAGTHAANATRVNALLASGSITDRTVLKFPKGISRLKKLTFPGNINFFRVAGDWPASVLEFDETTENWIQLGANCDYFAISGLNLQKKTGNILTGGTGIALANGSGWYEPLFEEILIYQPYQGMQIGTISSSAPADVCHIPTLRGVSIREAIDNSFVFGQCYDPRMTDCYSGKAFGGSVVGTGFLFTDWCQAGYARQCQSIGGDYAWRWGDGDGTDVSINAMDISGCVGDNAKSASFAALGVDRLKINGFGATQQTGAYVVRIGDYAREVCLDDFYGENGARDIVTIAAGARRTQIKGGYYVSGSLDAANTYAGVRAQDNCQDFQIDGIRAFNKTGYYSGQQAHGVAIGPGCDNYTLVNNSLRGNQTAGINNSSSGAANKVIANNLT